MHGVKNGKVQSMSIYIPFYYMFQLNIFGCEQILFRKNNKVNSIWTINWYFFRTESVETKYHGDQQLLCLCARRRFDKGLVGQYRGGKQIPITKCYKLENLSGIQAIFCILLNNFLCYIHWLINICFMHWLINIHILSYHSVISGLCKMVAAWRTIALVVLCPHKNQ